MAGEYLPYLAGLLGGSMLVAAYYVVRHSDLVYASIALALLGLANAGLMALLGFGVVASFVVIVYVGAAVMFIILSISMLGGGGEEVRDEVRGAAAGGAALATLLVVMAGLGLFKAYAPVGQYTLRQVAEVLLSKYLPVLGVLMVALAATLVEAIAVAKRGE